MIAVFVPVISFPTQLTKVRTELSFAAEDPWHGNRSGKFALDCYAVTRRGVKSVPASTQESWWFGSFHRALRSEADGVTRFLPESLIELWLTRQVSTEMLPALLKQIEPSLKKSDYKPILRSMNMKVFRVFEVVCCVLLVIISVIAVVAGHAPLWLAPVIVLAVAGVCWAFLYLVYFRMFFRRKRQMRWLLERVRAGAAMPLPPPHPRFEDLLAPLPPPNMPPRESPISPQPMPLATVVHTTMLEGKEIKLYLYPLPKGLETAEPAAPKDFRFDSIMDVPDVIEPSMLPRLRRAFPQLKWEDHAENWGKVRIWGTTREAPERVIISIVRKEPPGPFKLGITVSAPDESEAVKSLKEMISRLQLALRGWSQFHLPEFKTSPPSGIDIDQEEVVDVTLPVQLPSIRLIGPNAVIILSRPLLEALSLHGEILDSRAKEPKKYPGSYDEESRLAGMRGARARIILKEAGPVASGKDPEVQLSLVREAHYLVGELLENGLAQVEQLCKPPLSVRRIKVHYFGSRAAPTVGLGFISYSGADVELGFLAEFLHLDWWVA